MRRRRRRLSFYALLTKSCHVEMKPRNAWGGVHALNRRHGKITHTHTHQLLCRPFFLFHVSAHKGRSAALPSPPCLVPPPSILLITNYVGALAHMSMHQHPHTHTHVSCDSLHLHPQCLLHFSFPFGPTPILDSAASLSRVVPPCACVRAYMCDGAP